ncbi:hypothetical protein N431DRAFT_457167 [Stipitochalara longipes BDJ]|nr:hypothetical protein N431DRAFT_457167 [Stipitochalara longipes BDJ]
MAGTKRKHGEDSPDAVYTNKSRSRPSGEARIDPTYGQRSAIPGLDDDTTMEGEGQDLNYDEEMDALTYLRSVRQEASGIPNLLVAPRTTPTSDGRELYENGDGDFRGFYEDGAYVASSHAVLGSSNTAWEEALDQEQRYFNTIIARYEALRAQLQQIPPLEALEALGEDHPTYVGSLSVAIARWWRWNMRWVDPWPAQVASMDKPTVLRLLGLLNGGTLLKRGAEVEIGVSRWAWSLLARLPERGELTSEEIGVVRELGKKAVLIGMGLRENKNWEEGMREVEKDFDEEEHEELPGVVDGDQIGLDSEEDVILGNTKTDAEHSTIDLLSDDSFIGPKLIGTAEKPPTTQDENNGANILTPASAHEGGEDYHGTEHTSEEEGEFASKESFEDPNTLAAARARIHARLGQDQADGSDPEEREDAEIQQARDERAGALWNTKATVDMIITVAGEIYGQRDLLEFRGAWEE